MSIIRVSAKPSSVSSVPSCVSWSGSSSPRSPPLTSSPEASRIFWHRASSAKSSSSTNAGISDTPNFSTWISAMPSWMESTAHSPADTDSLSSSSCSGIAMLPSTVPSRMYTDICSLSAVSTHPQVPRIPTIIVELLISKLSSSASGSATWKNRFPLFT